MELVDPFENPFTDVKCRTHIGFEGIILRRNPFNTTYVIYSDPFIKSQVWFPFIFSFKF